MSKTWRHRSVLYGRWIPSARWQSLALGGPFTRGAVAFALLVSLGGCTAEGEEEVAAENEERVGAEGDGGSGASLGGEKEEEGEPAKQEPKPTEMGDCTPGERIPVGVPEGGAGAAFEDGELGEAECVTEARGRVVDEEGSPPAVGSLVSVCGPICYAGETDADGNFRVQINARMVLPLYSALFHGRPEYAGFYHPVPRSSEEGVLQLDDLVLVRMPKEGPEVPKRSEQEAVLESEGVELTVPAGSVSHFDFEALAVGAAGVEFRARRLDGSELDAVYPLARQFQLAFALAPFEAHVTAAEDRDRLPLALSFPNSEGWEPGAQVNVFALGSYLYPEYVAGGLFERVAGAQVDASGERVVTNAGQGIELLTWVGLSLAE